MIKYLGSKKRILSHIENLVSPLEVKTALDLFSGTSRVGHLFQNLGIKTYANDITTYGYFLATTYVQANPEIYSSIEETIRELEKVPLSQENLWFTKKYAEEASFFKKKNAKRIENIRNQIEHQFPKSSEIYKILIVSLMEAADRVDSTCGQQMAFLKSWAPRAEKDLKLRIPNFSPGSGVAFQKDAMEVADLDVELVYLDPPYNQHNYLANYHIWETLCKWDNPDVYGKVNKRTDVKTRKSKWNSKRFCHLEFEKLIKKVIAPHVIVSFNDEGYLEKDFIMEILNRCFKSISFIEIDYKRYVGAQIGIYNQSSEKVGSVRKLKNKEYLFHAFR